MGTFNTHNLTARTNSETGSTDPAKHLAVSSLFGYNVFSPDGDTLGKVKEIMVDISEGKIEYVVIEFGGFLGMNQKYVWVPLKALALAKEHRNAFILNETKESLKRYPGLDKGQGPDSGLRAATPANKKEGGSALVGNARQ